VGGLPPLPQLLPHLNQRLHLLRRRQPVVDHPAVFMGSLVEARDRIHAQVRQVVPKLVQILLGEDFRLLGTRMASHARF
jgi:hypothetical protein